MNIKQEYQQDRTLAQRALAGEQAAWRELYDETCDGLFNLLCFQTGDRDTARDLLQETYVTAMKNLDHFRGEGPLQAWLRTIALRKCLDWRRSLMRQARKKLAFVMEKGEPQTGPVEIRLAGEEANFRQALGKLSPRQRAVLILREVEQLSFKEISATLGCGEPTVRVHYHRATGAMRSYLGSDDEVSLADGTEGCSHEG